MACQFLQAHLPDGKKGHCNIKISLLYVFQVKPAIMMKMLVTINIVIAVVYCSFICFMLFSLLQIFHIISDIEEWLDGFLSPKWAKGCYADLKNVISYRMSNISGCQCTAKYGEHVRTHLSQYNGNSLH